MRVEITGLRFGYPRSDLQVLFGIDLDVASGSIHGLVGRSGCGKSTLLKLLNGIETPTAGSIRFHGEARYRHRTAMVFESPRLVPWWTVERNVGIGSEFTDMPRTLYRQVKDFYTSHVGLGGLGSRRPGSLSGGQQSRVGLGRALAHDADVLLMDEPLAHLDALARRRINLDLESLLSADRRTAIMATHSIEDAVLLCDQVSIMSNGPNPLIDTVEVSATRPRVARGMDQPGLRAAFTQVWDALEGS